MKIFVKNHGPEELTQRHFLAAGGEKQLYSKGKTVYNIYIDPANCLPEAKIRELSVIKLPQVIIPQDLILDSKNRLIGYTSSLVSNAEALCRYFTKTYKLTNKIVSKDTDKILHNLQDIVQHIHDCGIVIVDLNELNFLVKKSLDVFAIDTNSYQTPSFPATVIMPNIRDLHTVGFNEESDWFSWAIQAFQLKIGIHPYKGGHPDYTNTAIADRMVLRMKNNISAFNSKSTLPKVCEPLDSIPQGLKRWLYSVLEKGERSKPPKDYERVVQVVQNKTISTSDKFTIIPQFLCEGNILDYKASNTTQIIQTTTGYYINKSFHPYKNKLCIGFTPKTDHPVGTFIDNNKTLCVVDLLDPSKEVDLGYSDGIFSCDNRLYSVNGNDVFEVKFAELKNNLLPTLMKVGTVLDMPNATKIYDGVIIQQILHHYIISLFPESGKSYQLSLSELDSFRVLNAKYEHNVLIVVAEKNGQYTRFIFVLDRNNFSSYNTRSVIVDDTDLNFTVSDAGICVLINDEEKVEVFHNKISSTTNTIIDDKAINGSMRLFHNGVKILFGESNTLFSMSMTK